MRLLFTPFERGDAREVEQHAGLGLGLFISRAIVDQHGGTLDVRSTLGEGSTFILRLPYDATAKRASHAE